MVDFSGNVWYTASRSSLQLSQINPTPLAARRAIRNLGGISMRLPVGIIFVLAVLLGGPAIWEISEANRISQICWSAWVGLGLGFTCFGVFIALVARDEPAHQ